MNENDVKPPENAQAVPEKLLQISLEELCRKQAETYRVFAGIHSCDYLYQFLRKISESDSVAVQQYFSDGRKSAEMLRDIVSDYVGDSTQSYRILEFASGYGRVSRHLRNVLPTACVACSDIHPEANAFIAEKIGFPTLASAHIPEHFSQAKELDLTFALSLFSHLPEHTWNGWLKALFASVAEGRGRLAITTHGRLSPRPAGTRQIREGFWFYPASDQDDLATTEYGSTFVSTRYVFEQIATIPTSRIIDFVEGFWWGHQDLYVIGRE